MVMTLRTRLPKRSLSPEWEVEEEDEEEEESPKKTNKKTKKAKKKRKVERDSSESEEENVYESIREERIRENRERMEKLGIFSLSNQLANKKKSSFVKKTKNIHRKGNPLFLPRLPRLQHSRTSDRLKGTARAKYLENERSLREMGITLQSRWKSEVYTKEDEKLLGDCEAKWKLEVDGIGEDGDLLYDPVNGTSCHQCRYKTLRKHTFCNQCRLGQGIICGDCLFTRYGENVLEAAQNPKWLCPACRGICNCSRCRREKGWAPVTVQYAKVTELGFKSIAHYLILNRHAGNIRKQSKQGTGMVDITEEKPASPLYICSNSSADSDSDNLTDGSKTMKQSVEKHIDVDPEPVNEVGGATDENEVL